MQTVKYIYTCKYGDSMFVTIIQKTYSNLGSAWTTSPNRNHDDRHSQQRHLLSHLLSYLQFRALTHNSYHHQDQQPAPTPWRRSLQTSPVAASSVE